MPPALQFSSRGSDNIGFQASRKPIGDVISTRKVSCGVTLCVSKWEAVLGGVGSGTAEVKHRITLYSLSRSSTPVETVLEGPEASFMPRSRDTPVGAGP